MKKITLFTLILVAFFTSCQKPDLAGTDPTGEGLVGFSLRSPSSGTSLGLNAATPNASVEITWGASTPGLNTAPTYTWVAALKSTGNFDNPLVEILSDNGGKANKLTLGSKQLDDALKAKGIADGAKVDLIWSVRADNGSTKILAQNIFNLSITRFKDGASPFILLGPTSSTTPAAIDPGSTTQNFTFRWTKSNPATGGPAVKYKVVFSTTENFATPLFSVNSNNSGNDTLLTISYKAISDSLNAKGQTNLSQPSNLKWTVIATSGTWNQQADYVNDLVILREVRMYMPGSFQTSTGNGTDWTPANAPELIPDKRSGLANNLYYIYIFLPANAEFKVTQGRAWDVNYGGTGGNLVQNSNDNFKVTTAGVYRVSVNRTTMKYNIMEGRMGFVGEATSAGWNPPSVFPNSALKNLGKNYFLGVHTFTNGGWKLIDNNEWNNGSNAVDETRSFGSNGPTGSMLETNGPNMPNATAGTYRVIWDGRDVNNVKYEMYKGLRIVGAFQGWNPATAPDMNYLGNGRWQRTITLPAGEFKFVSADGWDFNYGKGATAGSITRDNGDNITVSAGTYTITVDEYNRTYTIQ
ncbi:MAG TPA: SusE domain-containing protein [Segetibacter sp.]